jgi:putative drug exporter of the RND superfamily
VATLARWCFRHRWVVLVIWLCALAGTAVGSRAVGDAYANVFNLPGTESTKALDLMKTAFPKQSGDTDTIVWQVDHGTVRDPAVKARMDAALAKVAKVPEVGQVVSPYGPGGARQISKDGTIAYAQVTFDDLANALDKSHIQDVIDDAKAAERDGLRVELGGQAIQLTEQPPMGISEVVGIVAAAVVLFLAFGSLFAMLLPILNAVLAVGTGMSLIVLFSHATAVPEVAPLLGSLIGLGVGIDYALFIVTRHRNGIRRGATPEEAAVRALNTSGRAVLFAGGTVCIALLGMFALDMQFLNGVAIAASLTVVLGVAAAATMLPAMFGFLGHRVLSRRERRRLTENGPEPEQQSSGAAVRWSSFVQRHPRVLAGVAIVVMGVLTVPVFSIRLGISDQGNLPKSRTTRQAYDLLAKGFGPGFNGPLQVVAEVPDAGAQASFQRLVGDLQHTKGVVRAVPVPSKPGSRIRLVQVIPDHAPQDKETDQLIDRLRDTTIPAAARGSSLRAHVGGITALNKDFASVVVDKMPLFIGLIIGLGFLLLLLAFRSLVVPLTAAAMNLVAAAASFGVLVAIFQWGWGVSELGLGKEGPIMSFLPVIMLSLLFGLSMDYQVFLVSRMHEEWVHTRDNRRAVRVGLGETSRVINSAAIIMICVFTAFILSGDPGGGMAGVGLAGAVALDAFILRTVLVPSLMHVFGRANWWLPGWLDRALPHVSVEPPENAPGGGPSPSLAEPTADGTVISGVVRDANGHPVPEAVLTLVTSAGRQLGKVVAASDGTYALAAPGAGTYTVVATTPALGVKSIRATVTDGVSEVDLDLDLESV